MNLPKIPTLAEIQNKKQLQKALEERKQQQRKDASRDLLPKMLESVIKDLDYIMEGGSCYIQFGDRFYDVDLDFCVKLLNEQFKLQNADYLIAKCETDYHSGYPNLIVRKKIVE
jgi:hypothetical protein